MKYFLLKVDNETTLPYQIRRSARSQKTRIVVSANKIEVVAPPTVAEHNIKVFVESQKGWIQKSVQRVKKSCEKVKPLSPPEYQNGALIPYQGQLIPLVVCRKKIKTISIQLSAKQEFIAHIPDQLSELSSAEIRTALANYMKQQARQEALALIEQHSRKHNLIPRSLKIKEQRSRWGSCGPNNDINLNWLLMLAPPIIMEYVIVHELCHVKHKNHSKEFWALVADHIPHFQRHRAWLKQHGASLMLGL